MLTKIDRKVMLRVMSTTFAMNKKTKQNSILLVHTISEVFKTLQMYEFLLSFLKQCNFFVKICSSNL